MHRRRQQPGFHGCNSQPILWKRPQRREVRRSASLVLKPLERAPAVEETLRKPEDELPGLEETLAIFNQCPGRLEKCRQRLSAAEGELERLHHLSKAELLLACSASSPVPKRDTAALSWGQAAIETSPDPLDEEEEPIDVEDSGDSDMEPWGSEDPIPGGVVPQIAAMESKINQLGGKYWNVEMELRELKDMKTELAAQLAASKAREAALDAEMKGLAPEHHALETESRTLRSHISTHRNKAEVCKKKLRASENEVKDLQCHLSQEVVWENSLHTEAASLHSKIFSSSSECEHVKHRLDMVELSTAALEDHKRTVVEAHNLHHEKTTLQISKLHTMAATHEQVVQAQIEDLEAQVATSQSEVSYLCQKMAVVERDNAALEQRAQAAQQRSETEEQECEALKERLQLAQRELAKQAEEARQNAATAQAEFEDAQQAIKAREADLKNELDLRDAKYQEERSEAALAAKEVALSKEFSTVIAPLLVSSLVLRVAKVHSFGVGDVTPEKEAEDEDDLADDFRGDGSSEGQTEDFSNIAPVPELVFVSELKPNDAFAGSVDEDEEAHACRKPARCQVDLDLNELRFQLLYPTPEVRRIPLSTIVDADQAVEGSDIAVDIELSKPGNSEKTGWLRIAPPDEASANTLLAALGVAPNRVAPGADLLTPSSTRSNSTENI